LPQASADPGIRTHRSGNWVVSRLRYPMALHEQFGEKLVTKSGEQASVDVLQGKAVVGIYYSAHWCPPCRQFTPSLAEIYKKVRAERGDDALEIVFVSGDHDESSFKEYYDEMPWTAVPYKGEASSTLNTKYEHRGIPFLVLLDAEGNKLTEDARSAVMKHGVSAYPWSNDAISAALAARMEKAKDFKPLFGDGGELKCKGGETIRDVSGFGGKQVAVVRCVTQGRMRGYLDQVMIPKSTELAEKVACVYICADKEAGGMAGLVEALPDGWFYAEHGSAAASSALDFYSDGDIGLVCCGADGTVLTEDKINESAQHDADAFPWSQEAIDAVQAVKQAKMKDFELLGSQLAGKDGDVGTAEALADKDYVLLYFSAHWCPPCRGFTPKLAERYNSLKEAGAKVEVIFCSSDRDEDAFKDYFGEMPWLALPFSKRELKGELSSMFGVSGIPTLVICNKDGTKFNSEGREVVMGEPETWIN